MRNRTWPGEFWERADPEDVGFSAAALSATRRWFDELMANSPYRVVIVRHGYIVNEWIRGLAPQERLPIASAAKSVYSNVLGIAVAEAKVAGTDARVVRYFPEMVDVPAGTGPKDGRHAFPKDRDISFRQLISNTSGYMKPGERPGLVFHYQTYGMNILTHAVASAYGLYDVHDPESSPGFGALIAEKVATPIGADWEYTLTNFRLPDAARLNIFGFYCQIHSNPYDLARLGWMWCNGGAWRDKQIVPRQWMIESTQVNPFIRANCPADQFMYGYGIWTNQHDLLWPGLPVSGYTASGAGGHYVSVFPDQDLVVVQNPGRYTRDAQGNPEKGTPALLKRILDALS